GWPHFASESFFYALIATVIIDSGHVYTTLWRTYFHSDEVKTDPLTYILTPLLIVLCFFFWAYLQFPGLWSFIVYATLFHHIRQNYGLLKWYEKLNKRSSKVSTYFLWAFSLLPIIAYHFREGVFTGYYSGADLVMFSSPVAFQITLVFWFAALGAWLTYEYVQFKNNVREPNRALFLLFIGAQYAVCFFIGRRAYEVLFPLLIAHGLTYFVLMSHALVRTQKQRFKTFGLALVVIVLTALFFGFSENYVEEHFINFKSDFTFTWLSALVLGFYLTPLFTHFALDAFIWKKHHREAQNIYN
ncbi:MAG: hypothetical protein AABZ31_12345, partial [Bdellovibrionota bacterium]